MFNLLFKLWPKQKDLPDLTKQAFVVKIPDANGVCHDVVNINLADLSRVMHENGLKQYELKLTQGSGIVLHDKAV